MWNTRNRAYSVVLLLLFGFFVFTLTTRSATETNILRTPGLLYQENSDNTVSNVYNIKIVNKTHEKRELKLTLLSPEGKIQMAGNHMLVGDQGRFESTFVLILPRSAVKPKTIVTFGVFEGDILLEKVEATFVGPK